LADPLAQKIIFEFLQDEDEEIGAAAADHLRWPGDASTLERAMGMISTRPFRDRGTKAKIAIMSFLARAGTPEALTALRKAMEKSGLFDRGNRERTRLCAVEALAAAGTPAARELLSSGLKSSNKKVSEACRRGLEIKADKGSMNP